MKTIITSLAIAMCFSLTANASSIIKTGLYKKAQFDNETWNSDTSTPNFELKNLGNGQVVFKELKKLNGMPLLIRTNNIGGDQDLNGVLVESLKNTYKDNAFVKNVNNITVKVTQNSSKSLDLELNFDLAVKSVFGAVDHMRITSDVSFKNATCYNREWDSKAGKTHRTQLDCIKMESFKNIRVTEMETTFSSYDKLIGFISDIVIQTIFSPVKVVDYLIPIK